MNSWQPIETAPEGEVVETVETQDKLGALLHHAEAEREALRAQLAEARNSAIEECAEWVDAWRHGYCQDAEAERNCCKYITDALRSLKSQGAGDAFDTDKRGGE